MEGEIARWRIAYDTISALVAADQSRSGGRQQQAPHLMTPAQSPGTAAAAAGVPAPCATGDVAGHDRTTSHRRDDTDMIQRRRQQRDDAAGARQGRPLTQCSLSNSPHNVRSAHTQTAAVTPPTAVASSLPAAGSSRFRSAAPMTSLAAECDDARRTGVDQTDETGRLLRDGEALVGLFRRLLDTFYTEATLWLYASVLLHPAARQTRNRLRWLGVVTGRGLERAAVNVLTGFVAGCRHSRRALYADVEATLAAPAGSGRTARLAGLAVELGVVLNPQQMMRAFAAVVRDLVLRTSSQSVFALNANTSAAASRLYR